MKHPNSAESGARCDPRFIALEFRRRLFKLSAVQKQEVAPRTITVFLIRTLRNFNFCTCPYFGGGGGLF